MTPCLSPQEGALRDAMITVHRSYSRRALAKAKSSGMPGILHQHLMRLSKPCLNKVLDLLLYAIGIKRFKLLDRVKLGPSAFMHR